MTRTRIFYFGFFVLRLMEISGSFSYGYVNSVTPESIGSTFITFMMSWCNACSSIPSTIGLSITQNPYLDFHTLFIMAISLHVVMTLFFKGECHYLETASKREFNPDYSDIDKDGEPEIGMVLSGLSSPQRHL